MATFHPGGAVDRGRRAPWCPPLGWDSAPWADTLAPADGRSPNVVIGVSTAHLGSPHAAVLATSFAASRLASGRGWTTRVALGGASAPWLVDAAGGAIASCGG